MFCTSAVLVGVARVEKPTELPFCEMFPAGRSSADAWIDAITRAGVRL